MIALRFQNVLKHLSIDAAPYFRLEGGVLTAGPDGSEVGFKLKGVRYILETLGEYSVYVNADDGSPMVAICFMAGGFLFATGETMRQYRQFAEATKKVPLPEEALQPV